MKHFNLSKRDSSGKLILNEASGFTTKVKFSEQNEANIMKGNGGIGHIYFRD